MPHRPLILKFDSRFFLSFTLQFQMVRKAFCVYRSLLVGAVGLYILVGKGIKGFLVWMAVAVVQSTGNDGIFRLDFV